MSFALPWYPDRDFIEPDDSTESQSPAAEPTSPVEEEAKSEPIIPSAEYFFEDPSCSFVWLLYSDDGWIKRPATVYKVHQYFFVRDSEVFRDMFTCPTGEQTEEGRTETTAILLPGVSHHEIECLLSFLYKGMYDHTKRVGDWIALLSIASRYMLDGIRSRAIRELELQHSSIVPVERIVLAVKHDIPQWLKPAYSELCLRDRALSSHEAGSLGLPTAIRLAEAREKMLLKRIARLNQPREVTKSATAEEEKQLAEHVVEEIFGL
ncbi:predicted protein [Postia placenta Mad-698-R]|nr:predicted protein [Postia placenta Mad-698-R]